MKRLSVCVSCWGTTCRCCRSGFVFVSVSVYVYPSVCPFVCVSARRRARKLRSAGSSHTRFSSRYQCVSVPGARRRAPTQTIHKLFATRAYNHMRMSALANAYAITKKLPGTRTRVHTGAATRAGKQAPQLPHARRVPCMARR